jgi:hypothetical protein
MILMLTTLVNCANVPTQGKLSILEPLIIPQELKIHDDEWACLAKPKSERVKCPAFIKLVKRDKLKDARIQTLMNKIKATH